MRRRVVVLPPCPEMGDVRPFAAQITPHPHLYCYGCGHRLWWGRTVTGATIYACRACQLVTDVRRVA